MKRDRPEPFGITIRVFLADADPNGLILVERLGWTGHVLIVSRAQFPAIKAKRAELRRTGVYVLDGLTEDISSRLIYVGEADNVGERLAGHVVDKDFWDRVLLTIPKRSGGSIS
jgi:hypothetical protein